MLRSLLAIALVSCVAVPTAHAAVSIDPYTGPNSRRAANESVELRVKLPPKWKYATALKTKEQDGDWIAFEPATLRTVVDSPLICGEHFRSIELKPKDAPPAWLHLTSESPTAIQISDELIAKYRRLIEEANALFGRAPHEEYHFLVTLSDDIGANGLEEYREF